MPSNTQRLCKGLLGVVLLQAIATSCVEPDIEIGSVCLDGVCEQPSDLDAPVCSVSPAIYGGDSEDFTATDGGHERCVPTSPDDLDDSGHIDCVLAVAFIAHEGPAATGCTEPPWLPLDAVARDQLELLLMETAPPTHACLLPQLSYRDRLDAGRQGWYYDEDAERECARTLHISPGVIPDCPAPSEYCRTHVRLICPGFDALGEDGTPEDIDVAECRLPAKIRSNNAVGRACMPTIVPESGFDQRTASLEASDECGGGPCLVFKLGGDPRTDCVPEAPGPDSVARACADPEEVAKRVRCSCRCGGPEGEGPFCECPDSYVCVDIIDFGPPEVQGGYCVWQGPYPEQ